LKATSLPRVHWRLAQLASHLVVALIALVVVGGATRVMEAGLACPDWPLCFGSFLPGRQMNIQVFLEWFHRLDAFLVGIALLAQFVVSLIFRSKLPGWLVFSYGGLLLLVSMQGALGALTVLRLLPSLIVTAHLALALTLISLMSALSQRLLETNHSPSPVWWRLMGVSSLLMVIFQCLVGGRMATTWSSYRCLIQDGSCQLLDMHRIFALLSTFLIVIFVLTSLFVGGWVRSQWPFLGLVLILLGVQIALGVFSVHLTLSQPVITVSHQLVAALLVAFLSALIAKRPKHSQDGFFEEVDESLMEVCHG
tara:strand:- start:3744 stop:4670 length:927 start_codon:yes stop_codon:yes gene_type:complete